MIGGAALAPVWVFFDLLKYECECGVLAEDISCFRVCELEALAPLVLGPRCCYWLLVAGTETVRDSDRIRGVLRPVRL